MTPESDLGDVIDLYTAEHLLSNDAEIFSGDDRNDRQEQCEMDVPRRPEPGPPSHEASSTSDNQDLIAAVDYMGKQLQDTYLEDANECSAVAASSTTIGPPKSLVTLPPELLAEIFMYGSAGPDDYRYLDSMKPNLDRARAPFIIAGVCRRWRGIALDAKRLWHYMLIQRLKVSVEPIERMSFYAEEALSRSADGPIDVVIQYMDDLSSSHYTPILELLAPHLDRLRRFVVIMQGIDNVHNVLDLLCAPTPILRTLQLSHQLEFDNWSHAIRQTDLGLLPVDRFLPHAPALKFFAHTNLPSLASCPTLPPLWGYDTMAVALPTDIFDVVRRSPELTDLTLSIWQMDELTQERIQPINTPELERLALYERADRLLAHQPDIITAPTLWSLSLMRAELAGLEPFVMKTGRAITYLDVRAVDKLHEVDWNSLSVMTELVQLEFGQTCVPEAVWTRLLVHGGESMEAGDDRTRSETEVLWPKLSAVYLFDVEFPTETKESGSILEVAHMRSTKSPMGKDKRGWEKLKIDLMEGRGLTDEQLHKLDELKATTS